MEFGYTTVTFIVLIICITFRSVISVKCSDKLAPPKPVYSNLYQQNITLELDAMYDSIRFEIQFTDEIKFLQSPWGIVNSTDSKTFQLDIYSNYLSIIISNSATYIPIFLRYNNENIHPEIKRLILNGKILCSDNDDLVENGSSEEGTYWSLPFFIYPPIPQLAGKKNLSYDDIPNEPMNNSNPNEDSDEKHNSSEHKLSSENHSIYIRYEDSDEQEGPSKENPLSKENSDYRRFENFDEKDESVEQNPSEKEHIIYSRYEDPDEKEESSKENSFSKEKLVARGYEDPDEKDNLFEQASPEKEHFIYSRYEDPDKQEKSTTQIPLSEENSVDRRNEDPDAKEESFKQTPPEKENFIFSRYEDPDEQE
ncbi:uncharacterized protein LOC123300740 [Chrysoperla carnea]|uniref:uncharacterized protein LOC123300740 n=1 Tax=Chrysoperla carnea TaxID=189513 RepID=UPI001D096B5F|nr:uncharacterized protein LOC123300740 [Chrysoperla carnea]